MSVLPFDLHRRAFNPKGNERKTQAYFWKMVNVLLKQGNKCILSHISKKKKVAAPTVEHIFCLNLEA